MSQFMAQNANGIKSNDRKKRASMTEDTDRFVQLCKKFATIDLLADGPPSPPWYSSPTQQAVKVAIETSALGLPQSYQSDYVTKLLSTDSFRNVLSLPPDQLETITGAVYQHDPVLGVLPQLQRFLAVISYFYHSFIAEIQGSQLSIAMASTLPPLALFQHSATNGPFTFTSDTMSELFGITIAVVSIPSAYRDHPVLWASLAHETGGHDVKHASGALLTDLQKAVRTLFSTDPLPSDFLNITDDQIQGILWGSWIDEAAADVYGLLNMGPTFALNLASYFAALLYRLSAGTRPFPSLRTSTIAPGNKLLDTHPTDILRLSLAIGVIENLRGLSQTTRDHYITTLKQIAQFCAQGATTVAIRGFVPVSPDRPEIALHLDSRKALEMMQDIAHRVGTHIATVQLPTLGDKSIQDIETWDDADELVAQQIATAFQNGASVVGMGNAAQLLAGATLALFADAQKYTKVTEQLTEALDFSYKHDFTWGMP
jgi:hypothetical protein